MIVLRICIYAPEGCQHGTHTNGTAYTRGTYSRVHTQTHTNTNKRAARPDKVRCGLTPWRRPPHQLTLMSPRPRHRLLANRLHQQPMCRETFEHLRFSLEPAFEPTRHTRCAHAVLLPDATPCLVCPPHARPILPLDGGARARVIGLSSYQRHGRLSRHGRLLPGRRGFALGRRATSWAFVVIEPGRGRCHGGTPDFQPADTPRVWGCMRSAECWRSATQGSGYNPSPVRCSAARSKE